VRCITAECVTSHDDAVLLGLSLVVLQEGELLAVDGPWRERNRERQRARVRETKKERAHVTARKRESALVRERESEREAGRERKNKQKEK